MKTKHPDPKPAAPTRFTVIVSADNSAAFAAMWLATGKKASTAANMIFREWQQMKSKEQKQ